MDERLTIHEYRLDSDDIPSDKELERRRILGENIIKMVPREALDNLQIIQPAIGCINRCNFCSQLAGPVARELDKDSLRTVFGGLKGAMSYYGIDRLGDERQHKPGVIFPYLDNDIGSYPHLLEYVEGLASLNTKTRISTVGWSRNNPDLQRMHETIATQNQDNVDGIRFSLTPYTYGWRTNHDEYIADLANGLETYKPFMDTNGVSRRTGCVEIRFKPDITLAELEKKQLGKYSVLKCDGYTLVTLGDPSAAEIEVTDDQGPRLNHPGNEALNILGDFTKYEDEVTLDELFTLPPNAQHKIIDDTIMVSKGRSYTFTNADGNYYCFNPLKNKDGFNAVHYYPSTDTRQQSGVLDATRPLLNTLIEYKRKLGYGIQENVPNATSEDMDAITDSIDVHCQELDMISPSRAAYIRTEVLPLIHDAKAVIRQANLAPDYFFRYGFLIDTGVIVNQGKAVTEFRGLASTADMPLTPNEEKGYGSSSQSSIRGISWRVAPVEMLSNDTEEKGYGRKSLPLIDRYGKGEIRRPDVVVRLGFFALNPEAYTTKDAEGKTLPAMYVPLPGSAARPLQKITPASGQKNNLLPGSRGER